MEKTEAEMYENVSFIDEYPELAEKVRLRHLGKAVMNKCELFVLPTPINSSDYLGQT